MCPFRKRNSPRAIGVTTKLGSYSTFDAFDPHLRVTTGAVISATRIHEQDRNTRRDPQARRQKVRWARMTALA